MARINKLYEKPLATTIAATDRLTFGQLQLDGEYKVKTILRSDETLQTVTYAQLAAMVTASTLTAGAWYKITNATSASFNLLVQAITSNKISCEAKDPLYPNDKVMYNFSSNVITWRWDTVNDISAGADWRNSNDIQIGTGCSHIEIGSNCTITIGNNCSNIKIGNDASGNIGNSCTFISVGNTCATLNIFAGSTLIKAGDNCGVNLLGICSNISIADGCAINIIATKTLTGITLYGGSSLDALDSIDSLSVYCSSDISTATFIYSISGDKIMQRNSDGLPRLSYINSSNVLVNVDAEA